MTSAIAGEISACMVRVPAEVVKQRAQAGKFTSSYMALNHVLSNKSGEGVFKGLYRGWRITVFREIPFTVIQFPFYEWMKVELKSWKQQVSSLEMAVCGSIAGGVAAAVTTPLDVLKTRVMLHEGSVTLSECAKEVFQKRGWKGFFSGVGPRTMWISAGGAIFLGVYEAVSGSLGA